MTTQILAVIILILTAAVGIWKHFSRVATYRRKLADEAEANIKKAQTPSDFLDSFNDIGRM